MARIGLYPGSFDPITNGHIDIVKRAAKLVDRLIVGVAVNEGKSPLFSIDERVDMVQHELRQLSVKGLARISVQSFGGLLVQFAEDIGAQTIIRGLRGASDFEYELQMVWMNSRLNPDIETLFLMAEGRQQATAAKLVKEIAHMGGDVSHFTTPYVVDKLRQKFAG